MKINAPAFALLVALLPLACGDTDDNLPCLGTGSITCGVGACQRTVPECVAGLAETCVEGEPKAEVCNGIDDDCNGLVDDDGTKSCGVGACTVVVSVCEDASDTVCTPTAPMSEICNGIDDDCDGDLDEGSVSCGVGACAVTVPACANGADNACVPGAPGTEVCNSIDDDCNGDTDEGNVTCGVGACAVTVAACSNGADNACVPGAPGTEVCNGIDDDCNVDVDDGYAALSQYVPLAVTGFNEDVVADVYPASTSTTRAVDGSDYALYSNAYAVEVAGSGGLPDSGVMVAGPRTFQLASFGGDNALVLAEGASGTLTLETPAHGVGLSFLGFATEGSATFDIVVNWADGASATYSSAYSDWFTSSGAAFSSFGRVGRGSAGVEHTTAPYMYAANVAFSCFDSPIASVTIENVNSTGGSAARLVIFAVAVGR